MPWPKAKSPQSPRRKKPHPLGTKGLALFRPWGKEEGCWWCFLGLGEYAMIAEVRRKKGGGGEAVVPLLWSLGAHRSNPQGLPREPPTLGVPPKPSPNSGAPGPCSPARWRRG